MLINVINCGPGSEGFLYEQHVALSKLLQVYRDRFHFLIFDKECLKAIIQSEKFGSLDKYTANELLGNRREFEQLKDVVVFQLVVDFEYAGEPILNSSRTESIVSYSFFQTGSRALPTRLVSENSSDFDFFSCLGNMYSFSEFGNSVCVKFELGNGAGSHCKELKIRHVDDGELVLCMVDSDKAHPIGRAGATARDFTTCDRGVFATSCVKILDVHEIENLIPLPLLDEIVVKYHNQDIDSYDFLRKVLAFDQIKRFYDLKKGMSLCCMYQLDQNHGPFWIPVVKDLFLAKNQSCIQADNCLYESSCYKFFGFNDDLLAHAVELMNTMGLRTLTKLFEPSSGSGSLEDITKTIFSWGCAPKIKLSRS